MDHDYRNVSFEIPMTEDEAVLFTRAFQYLAETLGALPPNTFVKHPPPSFSSVCPSAGEYLGPAALAVAQEMYGRVCETEEDGPDEMGQLAVKAVPGGVRVANDGDWAPVQIAVALIRTAQRRFRTGPLPFEWGDFAMDAETNHYGGGAAVVAPGKETRIYDSYSWAMEQLSDIRSEKDPLRSYAGLEERCLAVMEGIQDQEQYDLSDEAQRYELVEKALMAAVVDSPLAATLHRTAFEQGQQALRADASDPAPGG